MAPERMAEISSLVDRYNRDDSKGIPISPFIARERGHLEAVAAVIEGVTVQELDEFLILMDRELPQDHLIG